MRRAIACAALLAGCGDNNVVPDAPSTVIADVAPDAPVMPCTGGIELVGQFTATSAGNPPPIPVVMPTVGHPDGFDIRVATWHVNHGGANDTIVIADSAVTVEFTGYDAAALNASLAPVLTQPDLSGALFEILPDMSQTDNVTTVQLQISIPDQTAIMTVDGGGALSRDASGSPVIAPFNISCGVTFSQFVSLTDGLIKMANGADGAMQLVCD